MNQQAEYILLGTILKDNSVMDELTLSPDHFLDLQNRIIYQAMLEVKRKGFPVDGASLKDQIGDSGFFFFGGNERLEEFKTAVPSVHTFKSYEQMVINQWKVAKAKDKLQEALKNDLNIDHLQTLVKDLAKIEEEGLQEEFNLKTHLQTLYDMATVETPKDRSGIATGYTDIDNKTDGFQGNDLVIVGARPSMGKTAFMLNMAINAGLKDVVPVIFSLEMKSDALVKRMMSAIAEVNGMKLKNFYHYTDDQEKDRWIERLGILQRIRPSIYDKPRQTVSEMRAKLRKVKRDNPDKKVIVFIDYLTLIKPSQNYRGDGHAAVTEISADLKTMAKDFNCPVVCLAQLSRGVERREDKRPLMSDLRESGSIEQDADVIMMLYRDEYYNETTEENRNLLEVDIIKNREGEVGKVKLLYKKEINKIESLYHYHNQKRAQ